jgi:hypothetical protein
MDPKKLFADERLIGGCVFCGREPNTRDHVPSKAFLDDPLPENLPIVNACTACNQGFSADEEYLACFLEVVQCGTTDAEQLIRDKVRRTLTHSPGLSARIEAAKREDSAGRLVWVPELDRVKKIVLKLARGHSAYELSLPQLDDPCYVCIQPMLAMPDAEIAEFENAGSGEKRGWPEIGSRSFLRACGAKPYDTTEGPWIIVQPSRYRYSVDQLGGVIVRMVIGEYLACYIEWE